MNLNKTNFKNISLFRLMQLVDNVENVGFVFCVQRDFSVFIQFHTYRNLQLH